MLPLELSPAPLCMLFQTTHPTAGVCRWFCTWGASHLWGLGVFFQAVTAPPAQCAKRGIWQMQCEAPGVSGLWCLCSKHALQRLSKDNTFSTERTHPGTRFSPGRGRVSFSSALLLRSACLLPGFDIKNKRVVNGIDLHIAAFCHHAHDGN